MPIYFVIIGKLSNRSMEYIFYKRSVNDYNLIRGKIGLRTDSKTDLVSKGLKKRGFSV